MKTLAFKLPLLLLILLLCAGSICVAAPNDPMGIVKDGTQRALVILREPINTANKEAVNRRRDRIMEIVEEYFDYHEMARRTLGRYWKQQQPEKLQEFETLFQRLLYRAYISYIDSYTYNNEEVFYLDERVEGDYAMVKTLVRYRERTIPVDYRLRHKKEGWKVYDVSVEGISLVGNYRTQFNTILGNDTFDNLLDMMRKKVENPEPEAPPK